MKNGLIHLYIGDGKGKTTASLGLSLRAAGRGKTVVFAQFLKTGATGELAPLEKLGIRVIRSTVKLGFTHRMDDFARIRCGEEQRRILALVLEALSAAALDLLVLDEVLDAVNARMLDEGEFRSLVENKPPELELVLTGRQPPSWLIDRADYVSEVKKIKHPFDRGIGARIGIEK
ncbi:MAG: cob(I)yrinic acid a,c-diamide adenosyltransferase [Spirochaetaceae bacterium]|jgi:cob(I)alamin adenosyltransferase|nr:cob(I)yrinic acid a,c-diamide adenosyltransferase [Spirochaetaceae bacterium]